MCKEVDYYLLDNYDTQVPCQVNNSLTLLLCRGNIMAVRKKRKHNRRVNFCNDNLKL